ncbi:hypothetical protein PSCICL_30190 [Pseudomonas cichorii]|uniref:Uncharacterized protein n=1 Tax=Pseudomonas cichorii TaxID=36746 RepID=A0ABQ1DVC7_PSECI|nr:hypothetical protein PSCICE_50310 [Pseudomonas cichorii]GFM66040.1 hypothetical protein PSCICJ_21580 [Pseudomonas cichorii]GFM72027.1 hypothetical protein PSCICL_30190 [Pseudomonas cichorii]GFM74609.1 hypothetical protein PSCICM_04280 [Pseudomonas cichorii]GFM94987.1 hypothetical protein PSCICP_49590 [Pseudomonas cichorii]
MNALGNAQGFLGQRQGQGFGAGPDKETYSMGSHWDIRYVSPQGPNLNRLALE